MRRTSSSTSRHYPLLHALLALTSLLIHLSTVCSGLESIGPITTKSIDMTLIGVDESEQYRVWQTVTADFIMNYFKNSENVKDVQVECAMLYETVTEIPIGTYTGNAGVPGSQWTLGGGRRRLAESVRITYNQITSYKTEDPTVYDETYMVEEPFRGDPQGYIAKLKRSSKNGHYDPVVEVGVGIPPPTPPPTLKPKRVPSPSAKKKSSGGGDSMLYIIIGVACGGVLIMMLAGGLIIRRRRKSRGLGGAPQNIMVGNNPQNPPHSIFTGSTPQTMSTGVESGNNSWQSGNMNNMQAVTGVPAPPPIMMQDREEVLPSGEVRNHIIAPKGKLGITLENLPWGGPSYVAKVSAKSPLFGRVQIGDKVMAIDGDDVQQVSAKDISKLLARKKKNPQRQITIMRGESKGNNDNQVQPNQNVSGGMNNMGNDPYSRQGSQMDDRGVLPNQSNDSLFTGMNNMGNDPYGIRREGSFRDDRHYQPNHGLSRSMNNMGNDPYAMMREESRRDDRHFHPNHGLSRSMNMMGNDPYGMGREGMQRDDRYWQRSHSVSDMNNMDNDPYGMGREGSWRDNRDIHLNRSAHGIRGEATWRDDHQFQRRRTVSDVDNDPYGMGRDGRRREDRHFQRSDSVSSGMTMTMDGDPYRSGREGRQREDRDFDFNHSAPGGMNMDNDLCEIERERGRREDRDFDFNHSAPGGMNMDSDPYEIGREGGRREDRDFHPRHSAPPLMDSDIIDPHSHEGNNHFTVEPAAQDVDSKYDAITVVAPKGKLGFVLEDSSDDGPSFVSEIHEDSVLKEEIVLFDRIASVDDQDVKELKAFHISKLLAHKGRNDERKIVFLREKNEGGQNKFMV